MYKSFGVNKIYLYEIQPPLSSNRLIGVISLRSFLLTEVSSVLVKGVLVLTNV